MVLRRNQRGNTVVEAGLIFLPFFALMFAIFDFAIVLFLQGTFKHAVREGVRYAITQRNESGYGQVASIKQVVQTNAMGFLAGTSGASRIHVRFYDPANLAAPNGGLVTANTPGNIVEVSIEGFSWGLMAPLWRSNTPLTLNARSSDLLGGCARTGCPTP